jgi:hypothetical protein
VREKPTVPAVNRNDTELSAQQACINCALKMSGKVKRKHASYECLGNFRAGAWKQSDETLPDQIRPEYDAENLLKIKAVGAMNFWRLRITAGILRECGYSGLAFISGILLSLR